MLEAMVQVMFIRTLIPLSTPLKLIKTFKQFVKICIMPLITITDEQEMSSEADSEVSHNVSDTGGKADYAQMEPYTHTFEFFSQARGLLEEIVHVQFLGDECLLDMIHLYDCTFRIIITNMKEVKTNSIFLELVVDEKDMKRLFPVYEHSDFKSGGKSVELEDNEIPLKSIRAIPRDFIDGIEMGLIQFQEYVEDEYGEEVSFFNLVYERTGLIYQLRYSTE